MVFLLSSHNHTLLALYLTFYLNLNQLWNTSPDNWPNTDFRSHCNNIVLYKNSHLSLGFCDLPPASLLLLPSSVSSVDSLSHAQGYMWFGSFLMHYCWSLTLCHVVTALTWAQVSLENIMVDSQILFREVATGNLNWTQILTLLVAKSIFNLS